MKSWTAFAAPVVAAFGITAALIGTGLASAGIIPPLLGFGMFALGTLLGALLGLIMSVIGLLRTRKGSERIGASRAGMGLIISLLMFGFLAAVRPPSVPAIHDITTAPQDAPQFVEALKVKGNIGRDLSYPHGPSETPSLQAEAYPDLAPIATDMTPEEAFEQALQNVSTLGWEVLGSDRPTRIEATQTSRSFRFVDDIVIRLRPDEVSGGTTIDLRSTSRVGKSDLGANAARIQAFADLFG